MGFASNFVIIGHRGAAGLAPENTIAGFELAQNLGVDAVELDVRMVDGRLAVFHDATLDRTTDGFGTLDDLTWKALRQLDAGAGQRVPELVEVLAALRTNTGVNIELKGPGTGTACAKFLRTHSFKQEMLVSSFHIRELHEFRYKIGDRVNDLRLSLLVSQAQPTTLKDAAALDAWSVHLEERVATPSFVERVTDAGFQVFAYTVNELETARKLREMGVRGVFTDFPDRMLQVRGDQELPAIVAPYPK